ncbi:hypothetical protein KY339_00030 [Candidatus Woesearchaeota archaeon]|nr:hypothetical protein [Candidatus Woesearchaeota archaeon]
MTRVNIEIPEEVHKKVKIACAVNSTTLIQFINQAIEEKLKHDKGKH